MTDAAVLDDQVMEVDSGVRQFVTFFIDKERFAFSMNKVVEIIRIPNLIGVPLTSPSLVGLANLRGHVLPVLDLRTILALPRFEASDASRILVVNTRGTNVGLIVDRVSRVISVGEDDIQPTSAIQSCVDADMLDGVINEEGAKTFIQVLEPERCIESQFSHMMRAASAMQSAGDGFQQSKAEDSHDDEDMDMLVSFYVDAQEYAFDLHCVQEIVRMPEEVSRVPRVGSHILGLINLRNRVLPLVSLRSLFGLAQLSLTEDHRILVVDLSDSHTPAVYIGLVVDGVKEVLRVPHAEQDGVPKLLNTSNTDEIQKICRLDRGKRLVSVLKPSALMQYPAVQQALEDSQQEDNEMDNSVDANLDLDDDTEQMVVFKLADQEYGISIEDVQEITRIPSKLDKVPKTASFIDGMVNLRGTVLPVVDMRSRFDMERITKNDRQRILVVNIHNVRTGFVVDSVAEVLRLSKNQIESSPSLSEDQGRMLGRVVNLAKSNRMIQILTANELLDASERNIVSNQMG